MSILSKKPVFSSKFFSVNQVEIERDGKKFTKDIIEETPIVVVIPYNEHKEIYLISEYRDALEKPILGVIGGKVTPGDDQLSAAKKELQEEAGLEAAQWKQVATWETSPVMQKKVTLFFATDIIVGKQHLEEDEKITVIKLPLLAAIEKIENGEILVGHAIAAILLFDKLQDEGRL